MCQAKLGAGLKTTTRSVPSILSVSCPPLVRFLNITYSPTLLPFTFTLITLAKFGAAI